MTNPTETPTASAPLPRRRFLYAGVAGAAALAGAGAAWWKFRVAEVPSDAASALWPLTFDTPGGASLSMQSLRGKPLLVNFWATWCPPCIEELPLIDSFYRQNIAKGWQVVGLAIDQPSAVRAFLQRTPVSFPIGLAGLGGAELCKALGNAVGGLPFTVVLAPSGEIVQRRMGRVREQDLAQWALVG